MIQNIPTLSTPSLSPILLPRGKHFQFLFLLTWKKKSIFLIIQLQSTDLKSTEGCLVKNIFLSHFPSPSFPFPSGNHYEQFVDQPSRGNPFDMSLTNRLIPEKQYIHIAQNSKASSRNSENGLPLTSISQKQQIKSYF